MAKHPLVSPVSPLLAAGERLLWENQPVGGVQIRKSDLVMIPLSLIWTGVIGYLTYLHFASGTQGMLPLVLLGLFNLVSLYVVFGRFYYDAWKRGHVWYALTDRRVLIITHAKITYVVPLEKLEKTVIDSYGENLGTIVLVRKVPEIGVGPDKLEFVDHPQIVARDFYDALKPFKQQQEPQSA